MQRLFNDPDKVVEDMLQGFVKSNKNLVAETNNLRVIKYKNTPIKNKVGIVTGGGSGHKPAFIGYIGRNMVDAVAVGEIFSSPTAKAFYEAIKVADSGKGVAVLYGNYQGDNMNVKLARQMAEKEGIKVMTVVANDDVPSAPKEKIQNRRGVAGEILMWKVAGAKAGEGASLEDVINVAQKAINNTRSIGIGLTPCTIPAVGKPNFNIDPGKMELGIGHHGEPGIKVTDLQSADKVAEMMFEQIKNDYDYKSNDEVVVLISGLGATPVMELYILFNKVSELLAEKNIKVYRSYVGNYFTSLDMMGATLTIMKLDNELKGLIDKDCESVAITQN